MSSGKPLNYHVFISHSSQDKNWADAACQVLEGRELRCWIAPRNITPGTEWGEAIIDGIDRSRVVVLIFSANANESAQVRREIERAIGKSIPVLPLRIEDVRPRGSMEFALSNTHWLDAFNPPAADRLQQLADAVEALLGLTKPVATHSPESPPATRRPPWAWIGSAFLLLAAIIAGAAFSFSGSEPTDDTDDQLTDNDQTIVSDSEPAADGKVIVDETSKFQGLWLAVEESRPTGPFQKGLVRSRNFTLAIRDHSVHHRRQSTPKVTDSFNGTIHLQLVDGTKVVTVRAKEDGNAIVWNGIYEFKDEFLHLCYRSVIGRGNKPVRPRDMPTTPTQMFTNGEDNTFYLKLEKQDMPDRRR